MTRIGGETGLRVHGLTKGKRKLVDKDVNSQFVYLDQRCKCKVGKVHEMNTFYIKATWKTS